MQGRSDARESVGFLTVGLCAAWIAISIASVRASACTIDRPRTTPDGEWTVFESPSSDCGAGAQGPQIYLRHGGPGGAITLVSSSATGAPGGQFSHDPIISDDGRFVYFQSNSPNLVSAGDNVYRIYEKNVRSGAVRMVSSSSAGKWADGASFGAALSGDGRFLFFESVGTNLVPGARGYQIYRKNLSTGELALATADAAGKALNGSSGKAAPTADGSRFAFASGAADVVPGVGGNQVYFRDLATGAIDLVSADAKGVAGDGFSSEPTVEGDGTWVVFKSSATNWAGFSNPTGEKRAYRKNRRTGELTAVFPY